MITNKKIFNFVSSITIFLSAFSIPLSAFAVTSTFTDTTQIQQQATALSTSGTTAQGNTTPSANTYTGAAAGGIATAAGSCSIGTLASQMLVSTVSKAIGSLTGAAKNAVSSAVSSKVNSVITTSVPVLMVGDPASHIANQDKNTAALAQKSFSSSATTGGTFDGITNSVTDAFSFPSLDAIGFCVANEMIKYIANSTIQWINTGFKGSPVFVSNTGQFFQGIEDQELGNFVNGLAKGTLGINLCQPFKVAVLTDTLGGNNGYNPLNCSLTAIKQNYKTFTNGGWNSGGFPGWFELIQQPNNIYGATLAAQQQSYINITTKQNTAIIDLNWSKGYKDFNVCKDSSGVDATTGKCANGQPPVKGTLGGYIENQVNARGSAGMNRLNIATSFDQVVSALVNELIKIGLNKAFDTSASK